MINNYFTCKKVPLLVLLAFVYSMAAFPQTKVILDTDMDSDVDDVAALAMLHHLVARNELQLLGVVVTSDDPFAPLCADAINNYYDNGAIPIGFLKKQATMAGNSKYARQISETFPHRLRSYKDARESAELYRELLGKSADNSVVIVTIGHLSSLQQLLQSTGDKYSPLTGKELAAKKVNRWLCMGGMFPEGKEANFYRPDMQSTVFCLKEWSGPVIFSGWEIGKEIITGTDTLKTLLPPGSPVYRAFELYNQFAGRPSWDQSAILMLTSYFQKYFNTVDNGFCLIEGDGSNRWIPGVRSKQSYITLKAGADPKEIASLINGMLKK